MSFSFTRKIDYALVALASLAQHGGEPDEPRSAREIAQRHKLPTRLLMNLFKQLHEAGLVESRRGAGGGYWLARPARAIRLSDVVEAVEGPMKLMVCCGEDEAKACQACRTAPMCPITDTMRRLNQVLVGVLQQVTLHDLLTGRLEIHGRLIEPTPALPTVRMAIAGRELIPG